LQQQNGTRLRIRIGYHIFKLPDFFFRSFQKASGEREIKCKNALLQKVERNTIIIEPSLLVYLTNQRPGKRTEVDKTKRGGSMIQAM
jgi:hypothetical protein